MPQNFLTCDRDQELLLPPDMREWLPADHLAWFVIEAVGELDLAPFYASYRTDGHGRPAHDPQMMVALLLYAYAIGRCSSRAIERSCREDVAFRVICTNRVPDHATIARFRAHHEQALGELFAGVLELCVKAGIVSTGVLALDSTKIAANASLEANRDYEQIARETVSDAARIDAEEDERYGSERGDELPEGLRDSRARREWLRKAVRELETERQERSAGRPDARPQRLAEAKHQLEEEHELALRAERAHFAERERRVAAGKPPRGRRLTQPPLPSAPQGMANTTDPDSRKMRSPHGFLQGYNAQAVASPEQVIVACELTQRSPDGGELSPMIAAARCELQSAGAKAVPEAVLADAGYWSKTQIEDLRGVGIDALVSPDGGKSRGKPPPKHKRAGLYAQMRERISSSSGAELYRRRQAMIEPVFAQVKVNRGIERFQRRGLSACRAEWRLIAATHNLLKLWRASGDPAIA